eukprot:13177596-Ditylum_brightwellii.AAC.1
MVWKTSKEIPTGEPITTAFGIKQKPNGKDSTSTNVYATIFSKIQLNTIKFDNKMYNYLKKQQIYVEPDMFTQNNAVSPGIILDIHPVHTRKDDFQKEIMAQLQKVKLPATDKCNNW